MFADIEQNATVQCGNPHKGLYLTDSVAIDSLLLTCRDSTICIHTSPTTQTNKMAV